MQGSFDHIQLTFMRIAYERAREQLPHESTEDIAARIIAAANGGETDPDRLFHAAVRDLLPQAMRHGG